MRTHKYKLSEERSDKDFFQVSLCFAIEISLHLKGARAAVSDFQPSSHRFRRTISIAEVARGVLKPWLIQL